MAHSGQKQQKKPDSSHPIIRLSPTSLNQVQAVQLVCRPESGTHEKVVAEQHQDRTSLSKSPLPVVMPPPTAEGTPVGHSRYQKEAGGGHPHQPAQSQNCEGGPEKHGGPRRFHHHTLPLSSLSVPNSPSSVSSRRGGGVRMSCILICFL